MKQSRMLKGKIAFVTVIAVLLTSLSPLPDMIGLSTALLALAKNTGTETVSGDLNAAGEEGKISNSLSNGDADDYQSEENAGIATVGLDEDDGISALSDDDTNTTSSDLNVGGLWKTKKESSGWFDSDSTGEYNQFKHWTTTTDANAFPVVWVDEYDSNKDGKYVTIDSKASDYYADAKTKAKIEIKCISGELLYTYEDGSVGANAFSDSIGIPTFYYTVNYETIDGTTHIYPTYYISTAKQLKHLIQISPSLLWNADSINKNGKDTNGQSVVADKKIAVKLLCDIDLGGKSSTKWHIKMDEDTDNSCTWTDYILDIDGDGHTIYNGYFTSGTNDKYDYFIPVEYKNYTGLSIRNVTFKNMYLTRNRGLFGNNAEHMYLYNVDFTDCYATNLDIKASEANESNSSKRISTTIVLGNSYNYCFIKECTIKNSYIYTVGGHGAFFASFNGTGTGDAVTEIPSTLAEVEALWKDSNKNTSYPNIFEDSQTIDSEIYFDVPSTDDKGHQGTFVSCIQGGEIFRRCFSNCTAYGRTQIGVFTGACIGSGNGFYIDTDGDGTKETYVNSYFEDCFTSGVIEGESKIGGFIGMIFDDDRADGDSNGDETVGGKGISTVDGDRGICYFKNCYSTSSVGMQYSGDYVGGFVGYVRAYTNWSTGAKGETNAHRFVNCYAAGEVGGITTNVSTNVSNTTMVGGFVGIYDDGYGYTNKDVGDTTHISVPLNATNCYYDKQTTAMRERGVGDDSDSQDLNGTIDGLTGVYTKESGTKKNENGNDITVEGLTNSSESVMFGGDTSYVYVTVDNGDYSKNEYYPQIDGILNAVVKNDNIYSSLLDSEETNETEMLETRRKVKRYYSLASAATVFLDHYDQTLSKTQYGEREELTEAALDTTYDTVRDITRVFTFTSTLDVRENTDDETSNDLAVTWEKNATLNTSSGFTNFGGTDTKEVTDENGNKTTEKVSKGFTLTYDYKNTADDTSDDYTKSFKPDVLKLVYDESEYQCISFAPGKQWVQVKVSEGSIGSGNTVNKISDSATIIGKRNIRLLPTAYLDAGDMVTITVNEDSGDYTVELSDVVYDNVTDTLELSSFNHAIGVAYAISDKNRMDEKSIYSGQTITEYKDEKSKTTNLSFAITGKYRVNDTGSMDNTITGEFEEQKFVTAVKKDNAYDNASDDSGLTMVKVYKAKVGDTGELVNDTYVPVNSTSKDTSNKAVINYNKWSGIEKFEVNSKVDDSGYYYLHYYWLLDDGRYLEDIKLVNIVATEAYVEMRTGILTSSLPDDDGNSSMEKINDIDQYVYKDAKLVQTTEMKDSSLEEWDKTTVTTTVPPEDDTTGETTTVSTTLYWLKDYPTKNKNYTSENAGTYYNGTDDNGKAMVFHGDSEYTYTLKSVKEMTNSASNVVGWYNTADYKMTTLILEVYVGGNWTEMKRIDLTAQDGIDAIYALDNAEYSSTFTSYTVTQDEKTRKYKVTSGNTSAFSVNFKVCAYEDSDDHKVKNTAKTDTSSSQTIAEERYIVMNVTNPSATVTTLQNPIRVTALYQKAEAEITVQKEVLLPDKDSSNGTLDKPSTVYTAPTKADYDNQSNQSNQSNTSGKTIEEANAGNPDFTYYYYTQSLKQMDDERSMDNYVTGEDKDTSLKKADSERHAVLEGDTLTYRVRLKNIGYNDATSVTFTDDLPAGCTYVDSSAAVYSQQVDFSSSVIKYYAVNEETTDHTGTNYIKVTTSTKKNSNNEDITVLTLTFYPSTAINFKTEYYVYFQVKVGSFAANTEKREIENTAKVHYFYTETTSNTPLDTEKPSNIVSTDQVHLYFKIQKTIDKADIGRSFLFKVARYELTDYDNNTNELKQGATAVDTYIVDLSFANGTVISVTKLFQTNKDGYYKITEVYDWSGTDYIDNTEEESVVFIRDNKLLFYTNDKDADVDGTDTKTVNFTNTLDDYAYSDSQAYTNNKISK